MKVIFRTDASLQIGTGHVIRCLTLANVLRDRGAECRFVCREHTGNLLELIRKQGFEAEVLPIQRMDTTNSTDADDQPLAHAAWLGADWFTDAKQTIVGVGKTAVDWLIVDHYALDIRWESALRQHCRRLLVIDDLADRNHDCDLLLDQNLVAEMDHRYDGKIPDHCGRMFGPNYALLQPHYAELHPRVPLREGPVQRMMVYFGGADNDNLTGKSIAAFLSLGITDITLDVVINTDSPHAASIRYQVEGNSQIILHESLPTLAPLMVQADLAIGAGGATSWERCCLGLPTLVITLAENQRPIAAELDRQGFIRCLGHKDEVSEKRLAQAMEEVLDEWLSPEWSEHCQQLVDGQGAKRVSSVLMLNVQTKLDARLARMDDEARILSWVNDPFLRQNAFSTAAIDPVTRSTWFRKRLREVENSRIYVLETEDGLPVGQVCFERPGDAWEISYNLDALARGRQLGKELIQTAMITLRSSMNGGLLFGCVKSPNGVSCLLFEDLGFASENHGNGSLSIAVCSDAGSWINNSIPELLLGWLADGHNVTWVHSASDLPGGDLCFYLSYGRIVDAQTRARYRNNLVVHESELPKGKGWSPLTWQIIDGSNSIPVTLLEASDRVDSGDIYAQSVMKFDGYELVDELREAQAANTFELCRWFSKNYPRSADYAKLQTGKESFYPRRKPVDSRLDVNKSLGSQFNLLRVVDNERYPAFFDLAGNRYVLRIEKHTYDK